MRHPSKKFLIDGVEKTGYEEAGEAVGVNSKTFQNTIKARSKNGKTLEFIYKGHRIKTDSCRKIAISKKEKILGKHEPVPVTLKSTPALSAEEDPVAFWLKALTEELRYKRQFHLREIHHTDEMEARNSRDWKARARAEQEEDPRRLSIEWYGRIKDSMRLTSESENLADNIAGSLSAAREIDIRWKRLNRLISNCFFRLDALITDTVQLKAKIDGYIKGEE